MSTETITREKKKVRAQDVFNNEIVLYNDDVNTFVHVINTLIDVCEHTAEQAEQCAILVHYKGKCTVKTGSMKELVPKCLLLLDAGLSAEIV
jgi:ATP-dependent Clp protease adaptor protein ClpS